MKKFTLQIEKQNASYSLAFILNNSPCKVIDTEVKVPEMPGSRTKAATYVLTRSVI